MSAAARRRRREGDEPLDVDLFDLPPAARWREWMLRVEAAIFASPKPVSREALVRLVGQACRFDDLLADLIHELKPAVDPKPSLFSGRLPGRTTVVDALRLGRGKLRWPRADDSVSEKTGGA
jgi:hypothetical protein